MSDKILKTKSWPNGREWPSEIVLDVGSSMPTDVYGMGSISDFGVLYIRHDVNSQLQQDLAAARVACQTVKDWAHRLENKLSTLIEKFDEYADGSPDATPLGVFCNEMIGLSNEISLGHVRGIIKERDEAKADCDRLTKENTILRALAQKVECPYSHRNKDGVCSLGYPGCACADDLFCAEELFVEGQAKQFKEAKAEAERLSIILEKSKRLLLQASPLSDEAETIAQVLDLIIPPTKG